MPLTSPDNDESGPGDVPLGQAGEQPESYPEEESVIEGDSLDDQEMPEIPSDIFSDFMTGKEFDVIVSDIVPAFAKLSSYTSKPALIHRPDVSESTQADAEDMAQQDFEVDDTLEEEEPLDPESIEVPVDFISQPLRAADAVHHALSTVFAPLIDFCEGAPHQSVSRPSNESDVLDDIQGWVSVLPTSGEMKPMIILTKATEIKGHNLGEICKDVSACFESNLDVSLLDYNVKCDFAPIIALEPKPVILIEEEDELSQINQTSLFSDDTSEPSMSAQEEPTQISEDDSELADIVNSVVTQASSLCSMNDAISDAFHDIPPIHVYNPSELQEEESMEEIMSADIPVKMTSPTQALTDTVKGAMNPTGLCALSNLKLQPHVARKDQADQSALCEETFDRIVPENPVNPLANYEKMVPISTPEDDDDNVLPDPPIPSQAFQNIVDANELAKPFTMLSCLQDKRTMDAESELSLGSEEEEDALEIPDDVVNIIAVPIEPDEVVSSLVSLPIPYFPAIHRPHQQKKPVPKPAPQSPDQSAAESEIVRSLLQSVPSLCNPTDALLDVVHMKPVDAPLACFERTASPERVSVESLDLSAMVDPCVPKNLFGHVDV